MKKTLLLCILAFVAANNFAQVQNGLVAYYPLNGNTADSSGNNNNGTIVGGVTYTTDRFGNANGACHFDGSTGYITCPNDSQLLKSKNFSYSAWFRVQNRPGGYQQNVILSNIGAYQASGGFEALTANPPGIYQSLYRNAAHQDQPLNGDSTIQPNVWYKITVVNRFDSSSNQTTVLNYLNDVFDDSAQFTGSINYDNIYPFWIGANIDITNSDQRYFLGDIDEVKVYDIALNVCTDTFNILEALCAGDSISFYGTWIHNVGVYDTLLLTSSGCDSLVVLSITPIDPLPPTYIYDTICAGDSILFNGVYLDTAGIYNGHFIPQTGCDSMVTLTLTIRPASVVTFTWDSLIALQDVVPYYYQNSGQLSQDSAGWIENCAPDIFSLVGGNPSGGYYSGVGVSNDSIYARQAYFTLRGMADTIIYNYACGQSVSRILLFGVCLEIPEISNKYSLQLYPNPATDYLTIEYNGFTDKSSIEVLDMLGRVIKAEPVKGGITKTEIDTHALSNELYFLRVVDGGIMKAEGKFNVIR